MTLVAEALGRPHLLADLTEIIAAAGRGRRLGRLWSRPREQRVLHTYTLQLPDAGGLPGLMRAMRRVPGVYDVTAGQPARRRTPEPRTDRGRLRVLHPG